MILQESVTHSINDLPLPPLASVLGAAAFAAGDKLGGTTCFGSQDPPFPLIVARHCSMDEATVGTAAVAVNSTPFIGISRGHTGREQH